MTKFNIGDKVIPLSKSSWCGLESSNSWKRAKDKQGFLYITRFESNGDVVCSDSYDDGGDFFLESDLVLYTEEIANANNSQVLINKLEVLIDEAKVTLEALKNTTDKPIVEVNESVVKATNTRQQFIDEAVEFVEKYRTYNRNGHAVGNKTAQGHFYNTDLVTKGRKTTAIVYKLEGGVKRQLKPAHVGRTECAPDDVFNQHIGEAIALGRALNINVDKFINAVQPNEIVVGQVVQGKFDSDEDYYSKNKTYTLTEKVDGGSFRYKEHESDFIYKSQIGEIVDDTNAIYEV